MALIDRVDEWFAKQTRENSRRTNERKRPYCSVCGVTMVGKTVLQTGVIYDEKTGKPYNIRANYWLCSKNAEHKAYREGEPYKVWVNNS